MLHKFFNSGTGSLPDGYDEIYLCNLLHIPYTVLIQQPAEWVERMMIWHAIQNKVENDKAKKK